MFQGMKNLSFLFKTSRLQAVHIPPSTYVFGGDRWTDRQTDVQTEYSNIPFRLLLTGGKKLAPCRIWLWFAFDSHILNFVGIYSDKKIFWIILILIICIIYVIGSCHHHNSVNCPRLFFSKLLNRFLSNLVCDFSYTL